MQGLDGGVLVGRIAQGTILRLGYCFNWQTDEEAMGVHSAEDLSIPPPDKCCLERWHGTLKSML